FGTDYYGGANNAGTVFELAHGSSAITALASFDGTNAANPVGGLVEDSSGNLFGMTQGGGTNNQGTVFELAHNSNTITVLASFDNTNEASPQVGLVVDSSGNILFPSTTGGGSNNDGTVFELAHGSSTITALASFNNTNGANPLGGLVEDSSGNLFGTTLTGGDN